MPNPTDMPDYAAPIGRTEERRLRVRAQNRLRKLNDRLLDYDADTILALHEALDRFYLDTLDARTTDDDGDDAPKKPRRAVTG